VILGSISKSFVLAAVLLPSALQASPKALKEVPKVLAIQTGRQYRDYYGTTITSQSKLLSTSNKTYRWGITNPKPDEMAYFGGTLLSDGKHCQRFRASLYIDAGIKVPMEFSFKAGDRNGETLDTVMIKPGETIQVDVKLNGNKTLFFQSELKIQHGKSTRIILGEPTFE